MDILKGILWDQWSGHQTDNVSLILVPHKEKEGWDTSSKLSSDLHVDAIEHMHRP